MPSGQSLRISRLLLLRWLRLLGWLALLLYFLGLRDDIELGSIILHMLWIHWDALLHFDVAQFGRLVVHLSSLIIGFIDFLLFLLLKLFLLIKLTAFQIA